jgi:hypothetical protein
VLKRVVGKLTYANVVASLALFLALSGGVVWASGKIGASKLKANSVTAGKIKRNAISAGKIRPNAVTGAKIKPGSVDFSKLAAGTLVIATASGTAAVAADSATPVTVNLAGTATFTTQPGTVYFLSVEAKGTPTRTGKEPCEITVLPYVNGSLWGTPKGALALSAFEPTVDQPTGLVPIVGHTGPIGLVSPGASQTVSVKLAGDPDCAAAGSTVSVGIAVTQAK